MKKLLTMIAAAAAAFGLYADAPTLPHGTSFESNEVGTVLPADIADDTGAAWSTTDQDATIAIGEYDGDVYEYDASQGNARLGKFGGEQAQFLNIKTKFGTPLTRAIDYTMKPGTDDGIYFDSLVKLTACDEMPAANAYADAKIVVWAFEDETTPKTNLFVRAFGGDYDLGAAKVGEWIRLTIKSFNNVKASGTPAPAFAIFVDGVARMCDDEGYATKTGLTADALTDNAKVFFEAKNLFPSKDQESGAYQTIQSVAFEGQGAVDDLAFTATAPVAAAADIQFCTVALGTGVASFDFAGVTYTADANFPIGDITVTNVKFADGYFGDEEQTFVGTAVGSTYTVTAKKTAVKIGEKAYASIEDAIADAVTAETPEGAVIALADAITLNKSITIPENATQKIVIDLNGQTITGPEGQHVFVVGNSILFKDSSVSQTGAVTAVQSGDDQAETAYAISVADTYAQDAKVTIEGGTFAGKAEDGDFYFGFMGAVIPAEFTGGWFLNDPSSYVADGYEAKQDETHNNYWKVQEKVKHNFILMIGENEYSRDQIEEGEEIDVPEAPTSGLKGWQTFTQWQYQDGTPFVKTTMGTEDITLYAGTEFLEQDSDDNYLVKTAGDLIKLQAYVADGQDTTGKTFLQTADIVWNGESDGEFMGIGKYVVKAAGDYAFKGTYDGQNHTIENIVFGDNGNSKYLGVFAQVAGGTIKNLKVKNASTSITEGEFGGAMAVGHLFGGRVENVTSEGEFGSTEKPMTGTAAGIVCRAQFGEVVNCTNNAALYGIGEKIAGIIGITQHAGTGQTVTLTGCANNGNMNKASKYGSTTGIYLGGMIAYCEGVLTMTDCSNTGVTTLGDGLSANAVGELIGVAKSTFDCTATGCSGTGNRPAVGSYDTAAKATGLAYGVADNSVVAYTDTLAKDTTFILEKAGLAPSFELQAADDFIAFDETLKSGTYTGITAAGDLTVEPTESGKVKTFTAKAPASPWPTPDPQKDEPEAVAEAMEGAGFSEASAVAIGTKANYTAFQGYCTEKGIIPSEVSAAKDNAVLTFALGAEACSKEITSEDITIEAYDQAAGKLTVKIDGVTAGETIRGDVLAKILTAKGGDELDGLDQNNVTVSGYAPADGEIEVTVAPDESFDNPTAFFYQIELKK